MLISYSRRSVLLDTPLVAGTPFPADTVAARPESSSIYDSWVGSMSQH